MNEDRLIQRALKVLDARMRTGEVLSSPNAVRDYLRREIVKAALRHNAAGVIFAHNHPSGMAEPSHADELLTKTLKEALAMVDCRVLDHFVIAGSALLSFAERGLL